MSMCAREREREREREGEREMISFSYIHTALSVFTAGVLISLLLVISLAARRRHLGTCTYVYI